MSAAAEAGIKHGRLHLDEGGVLQIKREPAENEHQNRGHERHGRKPPCQNERDSEGRRDGRHQYEVAVKSPALGPVKIDGGTKRRDRGLEEFWTRVGEKEQDQRPHFDAKFEPWRSPLVSLLLRHGGLGRCISFIGLTFPVFARQREILIL